MAEFKQSNLVLKTNQKVILNTANLWHDGSQLQVDATLSGVTPTQNYHLGTKGYVDSTIATVSGDIVAQIPDVSDFITDAEVSTISGDIVAQIPTDYISDAEMTVISGDLVSQIPTDFYTTGEVDTISGDITTYVDDEVASIRASRGGTTFYFQDIESADVAGYEILGTAPGGQVEDTDELTITSASGSVLLGQYVTVSGSPNTTLIPGGEWTFTIWAKVSSTGGTTTITSKVYKRSEAGDETELFTSTTADINGTSATSYVTTTTQTGVELLATDRIVMKHYAQTTSVPAITITYYYEGTEHYSRVATPVVVQSISDHGQLSGLEDDDHTQYLNTTRGDARYYTETEVDSISGAINSKFSSYLTTAQFTTSSGDIVDQIPTDYISDAEMTVISGDIIGQIPSLSGYLQNVSEDTSPDLGGNLGFGAYTISGTGTLYTGTAVISTRLNIPTSAPESPVNGDIWIS